MTDPNDLRKIEKWMAENKADKMLTTTEPVAWAVMLADGLVYEQCDYQWEAQAIADAMPANVGHTATVCGVYLQPTLTDAEREAIVLACMNLNETVRRAIQKCHSEEDFRPLDNARVTLRKLLERLG